MASTGSRRKLVLSISAGSAVWLLAVVAAVFWWRPEFWVSAHDRFERARALAAEGRLDEAIAAVDRALAAEPRSRGYLVFKAYRQLDLARPNQAEQTFRQALQEEPTDPEALLGFARALADQGKRDETIKALLTLAPETSPDHRRRAGQIFSLVGEYRLAFETVTTLLDANPGDLALLRDATELASAMGNWSAAADLALRLASGTESAEERRWAADKRANALRASGRLAEAIESFEATGDADNLETRAELAMQIGRFEYAAGVYEVLSKEIPDEPRLRRSLALALHASGRAGDAAAVFRDLLLRGELDPTTRRAYTWLLNTQRRYSEAWSVIAALPRTGDDEELLDLRTKTAIWAGRWAEAVPLLRAKARRRPADPEPWRLLVDAWKQLKDDREIAEALRTYVRLRSQDWQARRDLADILSRIGPLEDAIQEYATLVANTPDNPELRRALGLVYETSGQLNAALVHYLAALELSSTAADLLLRVGRLYRWTARPQDAIRWYERFLETEPDAVFRREAELELAVSLLDSGNPAGAMARLEMIAARRPLDVEELLLAARSAAAIPQPAAVTRYLEQLGARRQLTVEEETWLADQYRASNEPARALAVFERVATRAVPSDRVVEAVGDLRFDLGDDIGALRAFQQLKGKPGVDLKLARTAARLGELALAAEGYERYLLANPRDVAARLEMARYYAASGRSGAAINRYREVVAARGPDGLRLELARVHLAAEQFADAERWAREALASGEDATAARLALAQSLHLQGRPSEANAVLDELLKHVPQHAEGLAWRAYVATALDRHLEAYRTFERAIAAGAPEREALGVEKGTAARKRGDFARALESYLLAALGATPATVEAARRELEMETAPILAVPSHVHGTSGDLRLSQGGVGGVMFLPSLVGSLGFDLTTGVLSQREFSARVRSGTLTIADLFPTPELKLELGVGFDDFDRAADLVRWRGAGSYELTNTGVISVDFGRDALLPLNPRPELRRFNRVQDIGALGPSFYSDTLQFAADLPTRGRERTLLEIAFERLQDRNQRLFGYWQYQFPITSSARTWSVFAPNVFAERYRDRRLSYYSPARHFTLGGMYHLIRRAPRWNFEFELNPQLLFTDGTRGYGAHGLFNFAGRVRRVWIGGGTFVFYDSLDDHLQWRVGGRVTVPLGK